MTRFPFKRVLIANRGEIAVRIIRALKDLGIESVVVYSDADRFSRAVDMADYSINLRGNTSGETYLNIPLLCQAILASGADAVHPGYGFLSESDLFHEAVTNIGKKFIGPSLDSMRLMGNKISARKLMHQHGIPMVPGLETPLESVEQLRLAAKDIGYPMILKAAAGGGGRGMRIVREDKDLEEAFDACSREALAYFGNPDVFCEYYIENPRHIEFQVLFDEHGHGVHLFERDCSIQRRHQKLLEEAPSTFLNPEQRDRLGAIAVQAAKAAGYTGAGTVEFICESPERAFFMEMNTRIQVEHPVTEMITGIDLIAMQIRIAMGEPLSLQQQDIVLRGWSLEARINAEDPTKDFLPSPGQVHHLVLPQGPFVRVDTHLFQGYKIPPYYDSMIAKLIVWGSDREQAIKRLERALAEWEIFGVPTTIKFHEALLKQKRFLEGNFTTRFLEDHSHEFAPSMKYSGTSSTSELALAAVVKTRWEEEKKSPPTTTFDREKWLTKARFEGINQS
jgi:acetyl-CoA carboxylase biotin carboxylase subunit